VGKSTLSTGASAKIANPRGGVACRVGGGSGGSVVPPAELLWGAPVTTVVQGVPSVVVEAPEGGRITSDDAEVVATDRSGGSRGGRAPTGVAAPGVGPTVDRTPGGVVGEAEAEGVVPRLRALRRRESAAVIREDSAASGGVRGGRRRAQ
jgi:hypothetical protein